MRCRIRSLWSKEDGARCLCCPVALTDNCVAPCVCMLLAVLLVHPMSSSCLAYHRVPWTAHALVTFAASIFQLMLVLYLYFTTGAQMKAGMKEHMLFVCTMYMIITLSGVFSVITISFFYPSEAMVRDMK